MKSITWMTDIVLLIFWTDIFFCGVQYIAPEDVKDGGTQLVYVSEDLFMVMASMSKNWQLRELQNEQDKEFQNILLKTYSME